MNLLGGRILLTGGAGFLGQHVKYALLAEGVKEKDIIIPRSKETDLRRQSICQNITANVDLVIHCAVNGFGIGHNQNHPAEIFDDNTLMGIHLIKSARLNGVKKFITIGSVCEYPKYSTVPFQEINLWDGYPENVNAPYAISKRILLVQGEAYRKQYGFNSIHLMLTNMYGPGNSFDPENSHVTGALIVKIVNAILAGRESIDVWGDGSPSREFLYVGDAAEAIILAAKNYNGPEPVNIGTGKESTIKELVETISRILGFKGTINWDANKPTGQSRQYVDVSRAKQFGFSATTDLESGLRRTISHYCKINPDVAPRIKASMERS